MIKVSENIVLKPLSKEHAPLIFNILDSEREYMRVWLPFVDATKEVVDTQHAIDRMIDELNRQFCIYYNEELVGLVGFKDTDVDNQKTEIGYWLSQKAQGKGVMTKSVAKLLGFAFNDMQVNRVQIKVAVANKQSRTIPERLGFQLEGIERDGEMLVDNKFTDITIYSLLKKEFKD